MDINQILLIIIVILTSIVVIFAVYFLLNYLFNMKREKKIDNIFDPTKLVEEQSLMNILDEKKNLEYSVPTDKERFVTNVEEVKVVTNNSLTREQKVNPFGVDMTIHDKENNSFEIKDSDNQNKFIN